MSEKEIKESLYINAKLAMISEDKRKAVFKDVVNKLKLIQEKKDATKFTK